MSESGGYLAADINKVMKFNFLRENMYLSSKNMTTNDLEPTSLSKCYNRLLDD